MQKWCPEPFDLPVQAISPGAGAQTGFEVEEISLGEDGAGSPDRFRSEVGFMDKDRLMSHLTREERSQLFELVELEVAKKYEDRESVLKAEFKEQLDRAQTGFDTSLTEMTAALERTLATHLANIAAGSARLAVQLAEKIVRATVKTDPEVLVRSLETTFYKIQGGESVTVEVSPADADWLAQHPQICEALNLTTINRDRRVESGGCIVHADEHTWDATIASQLETLSEVVEEMIATDDPTAPVNPAETPHEPGLD